jgi:hypothetical protein
VPIEENATATIYVVLSRLIETKSRRDRGGFTSSQLANALSVPRSLITRLIHPDPLKRVTNPKIETLLKIVDYFKSDGFAVTIDDLLGLNSRAIDVQSQKIGLLKSQMTIPLFSLNKSLEEKIGDIDINVIEKKNNLIALQSVEDIKPIFKSGSVFIVDCDALPQHNTLVAANINDSEKTLVRKYYEENKVKILKSYNPNEENIILSKNNAVTIMGVIIQVIAIT